MGKRACGGDLLNADLLQGFYLKDLLIEPAKGRVTSRNGSERLPPKATEVLLCLASRPGELVTHQELLDCAWGAHKGSREAVSHAVSEIRQALNDHKDDPEFVQTLPRRGYRLLVTPAPANGDTGTVVLGSYAGASADELGLFENLKQRGVLETGLAYLILGWLLIQVADIVFDQLLLPQWAGTFVTVLVIAGFPIALVLSWFLEIRGGNAVLDELSPRDARRRRFSRTYTSVVSALAIAAIAVFIYDQSIGLPVEDSPPPAVTEADAALPPVLENSIAVLPFLNLDGSEETQIFANGLVDDVITRLSRVSGLLVSSRGDAFSLQPNSSSDQVRRRLRVAIYLEGSVQTAGDQLRVIVQMIDSETGFHILSRSFDRPRDDFFDVRDEITALTVANVRVALPGAESSLAQLASKDPTLDVYLLYRRGIEASRKPMNAETMKAALGWFDAALELDPEYAAAFAGKCVTLVGAYRALDDPALIASAENDCARALQLNPNLDVVHSALGDLYRATGELVLAESAYKRALEIYPSSVDSLTGLGDTYRIQQRMDESEEALKMAVGLHPGDWSAYNALGRLYYRSGRYEEAIEQMEIVVALDRTNSIGHGNLGTARMLIGDFAGASSALRDSIAIEPRANSYSNLGLVSYYLGELDEAVESHREATRLAPNNALAQSNLGDALWIAGRHQEARDAFEKARQLVTQGLDVNPNDPLAQMDLAWIMAMLGKSDEARELIDRALAQAPEDPYVYYIDALIWLRLEDDDKALASLDTAVSKGYSKVLLAAEPHLASLRQDPRFNQLLADGEEP